MKPHGSDTGLVNGLPFSCRRLLRALQMTAMAGLLLAFPLGASTADAAAPPPSAVGAHVYLLRGVLNIFLLRLAEIAAKLPAQGINATLANHLSWASLA